MTTVKPGTIVEVSDGGSAKFWYAVVVEKPTDRVAPNDQDVFVWVETNDNVFPVREWRVRIVPLRVAIERLNQSR